MPPEVIRTVSPSTGKIILERAGTSLAEAKNIAKASKDAFTGWRQMPLANRKTLVSKGLALIQDRKEQLGRELAEQMGRPITYGVKEIETMQKRADYLLEITEEALEVIPGKAEDGFKRCIKKEPVGPTLIVFAWNVRYLAYITIYKHIRTYTDQ